MTTSGMHRRPFEGRHLVFSWIFYYTYLFPITARFSFTLFWKNKCAIYLLKPTLIHSQNFRHDECIVFHWYCTYSDWIRVLPCVAVCCPCVAVCCPCVAVCCPCVAVCCPCVAVCCPCVAVCCPCVAVCCHMLPMCVTLHTMAHPAMRIMFCSQDAFSSAWNYTCCSCVVYTLSIVLFTVISYDSHAAFLCFSCLFCYAIYTYSKYVIHRNFIALETHYWKEFKYLEYLSTIFSHNYPSCW